MPRARTGRLWLDTKTNTWRGRVRFKDPFTGKTRERWVSAPTKSETRTELQALIRSLDDQGTASFLKGRTPFKTLLNEYREQKVVKAVFIGGQKVDGLKSLKSVQCTLKMLEEYFGNTPLIEIDPRRILAFKRARLAIPTKQGDGQRSIATSNRELEILSRVLNYAVGHDYLTVNPLQLPACKGLIQRSKETKRNRLLTFGEELAMLNATQGRLAYIGPIISVLADTGMRRGELLQLEWRDVDLDAKRIKLRSETTKTGKPRQIALTPRAFNIFEAWHVGTTASPLVMCGMTCFRHAFNSACKLAGVEGLRTHDLRHAFVSRTIMAGIPPAVVLKASGHDSEEWKRYLNCDPAQLSELLKPMPGQDAEAVRSFAREVLLGLREAFNYSEIESLLRRL